MRTDTLYRILLAALIALVIIIILALLGVIDTKPITGFGFPDGP